MDKKLLAIVFMWGAFTGMGLMKSCEMIDKRISIELKSPKP
jgi:hypothetical protein